MSDRAAVRSGAVSLAVGLGALVWIALVATQGQGRWPWAAFVIAAAAPFLLLPSSLVQVPLKFLFAAKPWRVWAIMAAAGLAGALLSAASGATQWKYIALWPVCALLATWAAGVGEESQPTASRLLLLALPIWILAGVWDAQLQVRVPGTIDLGLAYFAALDMALFLLLIARPLVSLHAEYAMSLREAGIAVGAVLALLVVALPVGYLVGFLHYNLRWISLPYAAGRLVGLVLFVGVPEELLFRGLIQEAFEKFWGRRAGWIWASVLFGLTHVVKHVPRLHLTGGTENRFHLLLVWMGALNWRYALLATFAGLAYGWVYRRTGRLSAAALTHGLVDWAWGTFLLVP
ncbi:MAG: CPBP family intramembrane glutamic endopeptidase [Gemmatimonadales bacterium]